MTLVCWEWGQYYLSLWKRDHNCEVSFWSLVLVFFLPVSLCKTRDAKIRNTKYVLLFWNFWWKLANLQVTNQLILVFHWRLYYSAGFYSAERISGYSEWGKTGGHNTGNKCILHSAYIFYISWEKHKKTLELFLRFWSFCFSWLVREMLTILYIITVYWKTARLNWYCCFPRVQASIISLINASCQVIITISS